MLSGLLARLRLYLRLVSEVREEKVEKYTIEQAFNYFYGPEENVECEQFNTERGIRAVGYLLTFCSQYGNEALEGDAAVGLARILECCASELARSKSRRQWLAKKENRK
jgi:hypothetical protein